MRSPLTGIIANLDLLSNHFGIGRGNDSVKDSLEAAKTSSVLLNTLVNDILDSARISKGNLIKLF